MQRQRNMRVGVVGANGQLGSDICIAARAQGHEVIELNHNRFDIADLGQSRASIQDARPELIVNAAAVHQLEYCEQNPAKAFEVNAFGARNLAILSDELRFRFVQISTDYVFDGAKRRPYVETDLPCPLNVYGNSKVSAELFTQAISRRHFVVRVSGLYGSAPCRGKGGKNFVQLMLHLAKERGKVRVVNDEVLTPTYTRDLASQVLALATTEAYGLYHATPNGECSWYDFARTIFELAEVRVELEVADPSEFPAKTSRPKYSVLDRRKLRSTGCDVMPHWKEGLKRYLKTLG